MGLLEISLQYRVIIAIGVMLLFFSSFLISFISSQQKKLKYNKDLQALHEEKSQALKQQNELLEHRVSERTSQLSKQKEILEIALT
jgi:two-component system NtrC family sensor kinase